MEIINRWLRISFKVSLTGLRKKLWDFLFYFFQKKISFLPLEKLRCLPFLFLQLLERCAPIRNAWKARLGQQPSQSVPPPSLPHPAYPSLPPSHVHPSQKYSQWGPSIPFKYGPIAQSPWSKVAGPTVIAGLKRWRAVIDDTRHSFSYFTINCDFSFRSFFFCRNPAHRPLDIDKKNRFRTLLTPSNFGASRPTIPSQRN